MYLHRNMNNLSLLREKPRDTNCRIQSTVGRYIRGEISADLLSSKSKHKRVEVAGVDALNSAANHSREITPMDKLRHRFRPLFRNTINARNASFVSVVNDIKRMKIDEHKSLKRVSKVPRSMYRNDRLASTSSRRPAYQSRVSEVSASKSMNSESKSSRSKRSSVSHSTKQQKQTSQTCTCLEEPDVDSLCLCQNEILKKFVPDPGAYLQRVRFKLVTMRNQKSNVPIPIATMSHQCCTSENENVQLW